MFGTYPFGFQPFGSSSTLAIEAEEAQVSQAQTFVTALVSPDIQVSLSDVLVLGIFPTENIQTSLVQAFVPLARSIDLQVSMAQTLVLAIGHVANPKLRAWTFSLDGHDFYVLRLGDASTLVYDVYSEQWMDWVSFGRDYWRPNIGTNWVGAPALANAYGSSVVVGDDTWGLIYFLDPNQPYDQHADSSNPTQEVYFERIIMGQVPIRGREVLPCFVTWLTADMGDPAYIGAGVTLYSSDDGGETFDSHGLVTVTLGAFEPELSWYSLGQISAPGRLFKIVDDGAIARVDGLEMNDPDDAG